MSITSLAARNALRNKFRTLMTVLGVGTAVLAFVTLRTVLHAWNVGVESAAKDRLATRAKVSFVIPLPKRYAEDIAAVPGLKATSYGNFFGGQLAKSKNEFFQTIAAADNIFDVYPEMSVSAETLARWRADKPGAIVGDVLAKRLHLQIGDKVILAGTMYPGNWEFRVDGFYTAPEHAAVDRSTFYFHWDYLNEGAPPRQKNFIGMLLSRVDNPDQSAAVSAAIDKLFATADVQTVTTSERAMNNSLLKGSGTILEALTFISFMILVIMTLILSNTIAMAVRERTAEYGVLRAIGFSPRYVRMLIVSETVTLSACGAAVGCALAYPIVGVAGKWIEENMGQFFPSFSVGLGTMSAALAITLVLGGVASLMPALRAGRMQVTDALREVA